MGDSMRDMLDRLLAEKVIKFDDDAVPLGKVAMALNKNERPLRERGLEWQRYIEGASRVPDIMQYEIERRIAAYRAAFAPYVYGAQTPETSNMLQRLHAGFSGMVFAYYAKDEAITLEDYNDLYDDTDRLLGNTPEEQEITKKRLKKLSDLIMSKGVKLLPPQKYGHTDPADPLYGNLSDRHLSYFAYAFRNLAGLDIDIQELGRSKPRTAGYWSPNAGGKMDWSQPIPRWSQKSERKQRTLGKLQPPDPATPAVMAKLKPADFLWIAAERAYQKKTDVFMTTRPDGTQIGKLAELEVLQDRNNNWAIYLVFKRLNTETGDLIVQKREPLLTIDELEAEEEDQSGNDEEFSGYYRKFLKGGMTPNASVLYLPDGPGSGKPMQMVHGKADKLQLLYKKHNTAMDASGNSPHLNELSQYEDTTLGPEVQGLDRYRQVAKMNKTPEIKAKMWTIVFDGPEGGLLLQNLAQPDLRVPMEKEQVESIIEWGQGPKEYPDPRTDPNYMKRLINVTPPRPVLDLDNNIKPASFGPYDIPAHDKEILREQFKQPMDLLATVLDKYYRRRQAQKMKESGKPISDRLKSKHTASQGIYWLLVTPRFTDATILSKLKGKTVGKGSLYNMWNDLFYHEFKNPLVRPPASASSSSLLEKLASVYDSYEGIRDWVAVLHDVQPERQSETNAKRGPHETIGGTIKDTFNTVDEAIKAAFRHFNIDSSLMPDPQELEEAQTAFVNAGREVSEKNIVGDPENLESQQEMTRLTGASQRHEQEAATAPKDTENTSENPQGTETGIQTVVEKRPHPFTDTGESLRDLFGEVINAKARRPSRPRSPSGPRPPKAPDPQQGVLYPQLTPSPAQQDSPLGTETPTVPSGAPVVTPSRKRTTQVPPVNKGASSYVQHLFKKYGL